MIYFYILCKPLQREKKKEYVATVAFVGFFVVRKKKKIGAGVEEDRGCQN